MSRDASGRARNVVELLGVNIDMLSVDELVRFIVDTAVAEERAVLSYVNAHALNLAVEDAAFAALLNASDVAFCDGFGVALGARLVGRTPPPRHTPPDWIDRLAAACVDAEKSLYFVGGRGDVAERAAAVLCARHPRLCIVGAAHGHFDHRRESADSLRVVAEINRAAPDILVVGFGMPLQERWIADHWERLDAAVALPVGALFDYLAGDVRRAPRWVTDNGLEWLGRMCFEPQRLWRRYLIGNPKFLWRVARQSLRG